MAQCKYNHIKTGCKPNFLIRSIRIKFFCPWLYENELPSFCFSQKITAFALSSFSHFLLFLEPEPGTSCLSTLLLCLPFCCPTFPSVTQATLKCSATQFPFMGMSQLQSSLNSIDFFINPCFLKPNLGK